MWSQHRSALAVVLLVLGIGSTLGFDCARRLSVTHDEYWHVPVGLLNARTGRFHYDNLNPPLIRLLAAVPLVASNAVPGPTDVTLDPVAHGDAFLNANPDRFHDLIFRSRLMIIALSFLGGLISATWALELFGGRSACAVAFLWSFTPSLLAASSLVTTDLGAAVFFVWTLSRAWRYADEPTFYNALSLGLVLGLAQLVKFTCVLLLPLSILVWLIRRTGDRDRLGPWRWTIFPQWVVLLIVSLAVLNGGYLFRGSQRTLASYSFNSTALQQVQQRLAGVKDFPLCVPEDYLMGIDRQRQIMQGQHPVYLDGQWSVTGFPDYYLRAMAYKMPHGLQFLSALALIGILWPWNRDRHLRAQLALLIPAVAIVVVASLSGMQLGLRYVLPMFPFLLMFASQPIQWSEGRVGWLLSPVLLAGMIGMASVVRFHPDYLAYFNEAAGGPVNGRNHLLDSNLDWGQDLRQLKTWLDREHVQRIGLAYFGTFPPAKLGIDFDIPPANVPEPGHYAVSVNFVQGRPHTVRDSEGDFRSVNIGEFGYFAFFKPIARIGSSIDIYDLSELDIATWRAASRQAAGNTD